MKRDEQRPTMNAEQQEFRSAIKRQQRIAEAAERAIDDIAKAAIPDFHFLDHKVSTFWDCRKSPIGLCVWDISKHGFHVDCHCYYCGNPVERK